MNEIVNKILLTGDKFMSGMHLRQPAFIYSAYRPFTKSRERIQKFKESGDYQNELDKVSFQHDIDYEDFKDLPRRTPSNKVLCDKAFNISKNYDGYQRRLTSVVYNFFYKKWC